MRELVPQFGFLLVTLLLLGSEWRLSLEIRALYTTAQCFTALETTLILLAPKLNGDAFAIFSQVQLISSYCSVASMCAGVSKVRHW